MKRLIILSIIALLAHTTTIAGFKDGLGTKAGSTPIILHNQEIVADSPHSNDDFGWDLEVSGDTVVIGAKNEPVAGQTDSGAAYIYVKNGLFWEEQARLTAPIPTSGRYFGTSVAIDGDTILISEPSNTVYVFVRNAGIWGLQDSLTGSTQGFNSEFGIDIAIDGNRAIIGAEDANSANDLGAAYIFERSGTSWTEDAILTGFDSVADDRFGSAVAIEGDTAVVGAQEDSVVHVSQGSVYVFTDEISGWTLQQKILSPAADGGYEFGDAVRIDGNRLLVAEHYATAPMFQSGAAHTFTRTASSWTHETTLSASDAAIDNEFGFSIALEGNTIVIGAQFGDGYATNSGSGYVFKHDGTSWVESRRLFAGHAEPDENLGHSIDFSGDTVIIGAPLHDTAFGYRNRIGSRSFGAANAGGVYFFNIFGPTAARVSISGRGLTADGRAIPYAIVHLTDEGGRVKTARTNMFGYYFIEDIEVGQTIVLNAYSKRYQFETRVVNLNSSLTQFDFIAQSTK